MASFNKWIGLGNLTRDPQLKMLPSQMSVCEFGLAMNHKYRTKQGEDREEVCFVECVAYGKQADTINTYCQKGRPLHVEGRLKYESWEDKQGGGKRSRLIVVVEGFQFLGSNGDNRDEGGGGGNGGRRTDRSTDQTGGYQNRKPQQRQPQEPPFSENQEFKEDDIPF